MSTAGWMPRASSRSSAIASSSLTSASSSSAAASSGASRMRRMARRRSMASHVRRSCAPSWRLRSSRWRSMSPARTSRARDVRRPSASAARSDTTAARISVESPATSDEELRVEHGAGDRAECERPHVVGRVPERDRHGDRDRECRAALSVPQRDPDQRREREERHRIAAAGRDVAQHDTRPRTPPRARAPGRCAARGGAGTATRRSRAARRSAHRRSRPATTSARPSSSPAS